MATDGSTGNTGPDTSKDVDAKAGTANVDTKDTGKDGGTGDAKDVKGTDDKDTTNEDTTGLKKALNETRKERDALLKAQRDAELAKLPELERAKTQVDELTKENEKLSIENRRYKVAMKLGLPWSIGKRLTGDTDEEMEADGAELAKTYNGDSKKVIDDPKNKRPPNDAKKTGTAGQPGMNDILRALRRG